MLKPRAALSRIGQGESSTSRLSYRCPFRGVGGSRRAMSSPSTAAAELFQKSDEIVGHASIADTPRQAPTFLRRPAARNLAPLLTLCSHVHMCHMTTADRRRQAPFGSS